jgi:hypothetical protein
MSCGCYDTDKEKKFAESAAFYEKPIHQQKYKNLDVKKFSMYSYGKSSMKYNASLSPRSNHLNN